jgi:hypothetical protein
LKPILNFRGRSANFAIIDEQPCDGSCCVARIDQFVRIQACQRMAGYIADVVEPRLFGREAAALKS